MQPHFDNQKQIHREKVMYSNSQISRLKITKFRKYFQVQIFLVVTINIILIGSHWMVYFWNPSGAKSAGTTEC